MACPTTLFDHFVAASTYKAIVASFRDLTNALGLDPLQHTTFYSKLKGSLSYWKAQKLWTLLDKRAAQKEYKRQRIGHQYKVLVIGAGPCGLRAAIEVALLGAKCVVVEKRDRFTRNNVLHIWPFVITDLKNLGAKLFYPKFCAGSIDHISIRQLQCVLLKVALVLGVEVHEGLGFSQIVQPGPDPRDGRHMSPHSPPPPCPTMGGVGGWRALFEPAHHFLEDYEFNVLIGADGKRNTVPGFARRELRGKLAIGITANFKNRRTQAEEQVPEISGVAFIFNQQFFKDMKEETGIDLENIVYYKDETHYFVMCAKKASLLEKGVIVKDYEEAASLLSHANVDNAALLEYARQAADFATQKKMPKLEFAVNGFGLPDVAMFDFTSLFSAENSCRILERGGERLLLSIVGDSLHEPFWPTGSGCARGFLSVMDTAWFLRSYALGKMTALEVIAEREFFYKRLAQTTPRTLAANFAKYTIDPRSRYPVSPECTVLPHQVLDLFDTDDPGGVREHEALCSAGPSPAKRRSFDLLETPALERSPYLQRQSVIVYIQHLLSAYNLRVFNLDLAWADGVLLCALLHRFKPEAVDLHRVNEAPASENLRLAFRLLQSEFGLRLPDTLASALALPAGVIVEEDTPLPEEWDVEREAMLELLSALREKLREMVAERLRLFQLAQPQQPQSSPERKRQRTPKALPPPPSRALLESNRKADQEIGPGEEGALSDTELKDVEEEEVEAWLAEWEAEETTTRHSKRVEDIRSSLFDRPNKCSWKIDSKAGLVEKLDPGRLRDVEQLLLGELPGRVREVEEKRKRKAGVKARKLAPSEIEEMEKKLEETAMGNLLYRKPDYVKPYSRQDSLMVAATTADLKEKAKSGFREPGTGTDRFSSFDTKMKELDAKLRLPNKSGAIPVASLKGSVGSPSAMNGKPSMESLPGSRTPTSPPPPPPKNVSLASRSMATPVSAAAEMRRPATLTPARNACFVCEAQVYLAEKLTAEGLTLHKRCFRCAYCQAPLRPGGYGFERNDSYGQQFWCLPHLRLPDAEKFAKLRRKATVTSPRATTPGRIHNPASTPPSQPQKVKASVAIANLPSLVGLSPNAPKSTVARTPSEEFAPYSSSIFARAMNGKEGNGESSRRSSSAAQTPERAEFEFSFALAGKAPTPSKGAILGPRGEDSEELDEEEIQRRNHIPSSLEQEEEDVNEPEQEGGSSSRSTSSSSEQDEDELWDWQRAELNSTLERVANSATHPASLTYQEAAAIAKSWRDHRGEEEDETGDELEDEEDVEEDDELPPSPVNTDAIREATLRKLEQTREEARERARLKSDTELLTPANRNSAPAMRPPSVEPPIPSRPSRCVSVAEEDLVGRGGSPPPGVKFRPAVGAVEESEPALLSPRNRLPIPVPELPPSSESGKEAKIKAKQDDDLRLSDDEEEEVFAKTTQSRVSKSKSRDSLGGEVTEAEIRRVQRAAERLVQEKERARAHEAQELQRSLAELDVRRAEISDAGRKTETRLVGMRSTDAGPISEGRLEACFNHWLVLAKEHRRLGARATDLSLKCRELELENEHARLQLELNSGLRGPGEKSTGELESEGRVLEALLANVRQRDALIAQRQAHDAESTALAAHLASLTLAHPLPPLFQ